MDTSVGPKRWKTLVNAVKNLQVPQNAANFLTSWEPVSFSRRTLLFGGSKLGEGVVAYVLFKIRDW